MLSGGVFGAPSAPGPSSSSPPPGTTFGVTCDPPISLSNSPEINRRWILLSCLTLNGAAPAELPSAGMSPAASSPAETTTTRTRRRIGMQPSPSISPPDSRGNRRDTVFGELDATTAGVVGQEGTFWLKPRGQLLRHLRTIPPSRRGLSRTPHPGGPTSNRPRKGGSLVRSSGKRQHV